MIITLALCDWWLVMTNDWTNDRKFYEIFIVGLIIYQPNTLFMNLWFGLNDRGCLSLMVLNFTARVTDEYNFLKQINN